MKVLIKKNPMELLSNVKFVSFPSEIELTVCQFNIKKGILLSILKKYFSDFIIVCDEESKYIGPACDFVKKINCVDYLNPNIERVSGYHDVENNSCVKIELRPFKNFPVKMPEIIAQFGLFGVWWLLNANNMTKFSYEQVKGINKCLVMLSGMFTTDIVEISKYFTTVEKNGQNYVIVKYED